MAEDSSLQGQIRALLRDHRDRLGYGHTLTLNQYLEKMGRGESLTSSELEKVKQIVLIAGSGTASPSEGVGDVLTRLDVSLESPPQGPSESTATQLGASLASPPAPQSSLEAGGSSSPTTPPAPTVLYVSPPSAGKGSLPTPSHPSLGGSVAGMGGGQGGSPPGLPPTPSHSNVGGSGWGSSQTVVIPPPLPSQPPPLPTPQYKNPQLDPGDWINRLLTRLGGRSQDVKDSENKLLEAHKKLFDAQQTFNTAPRDYKAAEVAHERAYLDRESAKKAGTATLQHSRDVEDAARRMRAARKRMDEAPDDLAEAQKAYKYAEAEYKSNKGLAGDKKGLGNVLKALGFGTLGEMFQEEGEESRLHRLASVGNQQAAQQLGQLRANRALQGMQNIGAGARQLTPTATPGQVVAGGGQTAQGIGQSMQSLGGRMGQVGAVVAGMGSLVKMLGQSVDAIQKWSDELQNSMYKIGEFSGDMQAVAAEEQRRNVMLSRERGNRLAGSARELMESRTRLQRSMAPYQDAWSGAWSTILTYLNTALAKILEKLDILNPDDKKNGMGVDWAEEIANAAFIGPTFSDRLTPAQTANDIVLGGRPQRFQ